MGATVVLSADEIFDAVQRLSPHDQWDLVSRLWEALPPDAWPPPSAEDIAEWDRRMADLESGREQAIPGDQVRQWLRDRVNRLT